MRESGRMKPDDMQNEPLRVTRSRILSVRRHDPRKLSVGDEAIVEFGPGLLRLLSLAEENGGPLGEGFSPEWVIPVGAAGTAAYAVVDPPEWYEQVNSWTGVTNTIEWTRAARNDETLLAVCRLESLGRTSAHLPYRVVSKEHKDVLVTGKFVFVSEGSEGPRPFQATFISERAFPRKQRKEETPTVSGDEPVGSLRARMARVILPPAAEQALRRALKRTRGSSSGEGPPMVWVQKPHLIRLGTSDSVVVEVRNSSRERLEVVLVPLLPHGNGLDFEWRTASAFSLGPREVRTVVGHLTALRPHEVNLGQPWVFHLQALTRNRELARLRCDLSVPDEEPGTIFYVLTEDCETFDGGAVTGDYGDAKRFGNANNFMDPEEYRVQMIEKPNRLNEIAEQNGAFWTHFWTATQRFAAGWAASHSKTGAWDRIAADMDESVRTGSRTHEYAPHIHFDFEPDSRLPPQPRLNYDPETDGILPNDYYDPDTNPGHRYHGWDGARKGISYVKEEGDLVSPDTKTGSLRRSARFIARLTYGGRQSLITRTGACDFGGTPDDLAVSRRALRANGILADADAGHYESVGSHPRGRQIYFCHPDDLESEIHELEQASLVQLRGPEVFLDAATLEELNSWFNRRVADSEGPGVRAIVSMAHAMFVAGHPDPFRSTSGGQFDVIDQHLDYVASHYPDVRFATATEAVLEFLDYYSPEPLAVPGPPIARSNDGKILVLGVRILGRGIPITEDRPARLTVSSPTLFEPEEVERLTVLRGSEEVSSAFGPWNGLPSITFDATTPAGYEMEVQIKSPLPALADPAVAGRDALWSTESSRFEIPPEPRRPDLFRLRKPNVIREVRRDPTRINTGDFWAWSYPGDLFRLLAWPIAGASEPLGRRVHPYGRFAEGMGVHAAMRVAGPGFRPHGVHVHWKKHVLGRADFYLEETLREAGSGKLVFAAKIWESGLEVAEVNVELKSES